ncbi:hypothetical protein [Actinophytocola sp.]|uniref:hypothetical protein n=1 Tax=Actinophytocola sp. TaxID=1872138 RepID=UPI002ECFD657
MTTPPPSTTSGPSAGPSGVQAPDGYKTDTDQMSSAGRNINTKAEDAKGDVEEVKPAKVKAAEFGEHADHQAWQPDYAAAIEALGTASTAMCDNLMAFAGQLGGAGSTYAEQESSAQNTVSQSGAGL